MKDKIPKEMSLLKNTLFEFNNEFTNHIEMSEIDNDTDLKFTLLDMQKFAERCLTKTIDKSPVLLDCNEILLILLKHTGLDKGGDVDLALKLTSAAKEIVESKSGRKLHESELGHKLNSINKENIKSIYDDIIDKNKIDEK